MYGAGPGSNSRSLDLQSDLHLLPDTLRTVLRGPVNHIVPTNKFLSKCQIVSPFLCNFCNMDWRLKQCIICFGSVDMCNSFGQNLEIFLSKLP